MVANVIDHFEFDVLHPQMGLEDDFDHPADQSITHCSGPFKEQWPINNPEQTMRVNEIESNMLLRPVNGLPRPFDPSYETPDIQQLSFRHGQPTAAAHTSLDSIQHSWQMPMAMVDAYPSMPAIAPVAINNNEPFNASPFSTSYPDPPMSTTVAPSIEDIATHGVSKLDQPLYDGSPYGLGDFYEDHIPFNGDVDCREACVADTDADGSSDQKSYAKLLFECLQQAPEKQMSLKEIYAWIAQHSLKARGQSGEGWKNSVRHNLSMNAAFVRVSRSSNQKSSLWRLTEKALSDGAVHSTTRFRKNTKRSSRKGAAGNHRPNVARQRSGAKGGRATRDARDADRRAREMQLGYAATDAHRYDLRRQVEVVPAYANPFLMNGPTSSPHMGNQSFLDTLPRASMPFRTAPSSFPQPQLEAHQQLGQEMLWRPAQHLNQPFFGDVDTTPSLTPDNTPTATCSPRDTWPGYSMSPQPPPIAFR